MEFTDAISGEHCSHTDFERDRFDEINLFMVAPHKTLVCHEFSRT